jgi:FAD dependent oxidoreductase
MSEPIETGTSSVPSAAAYADQPNRSPWIAQLTVDGAPQPLAANTSADLVVVGAGIAGVATSFFVLTTTSNSVLLVERDRVARGATGRNAGQVTTYFERPLSEIADEFGAAKAVDAQRGFDDAHDLLDTMVAESGATVRVERFTGHLGMFSLSQLQVHLASKLIRQQGGLRPQECLVSEDAEFLSQIPARFSGLYTVVPQSRIRELIECPLRLRHPPHLRPARGHTRSTTPCTTARRPSRGSC